MSEGHSHDHHHGHDHSRQHAQEQAKAMELYSEYQLVRGKEAYAEYIKGTILSKGKDLQLEYQPESGEWSAMQISPHLGYSIKNMELSIHEIPANGHTSTHRHSFQEQMFILKGKGYSFVNGKRYDWKAGDSLAIPVWTWHQHFNGSQTERVRYFSFTDAPFLEFLALAAIEDKGDAPPVK